MQNLQQALISFFEQVAQRNSTQLKKLKQEQCFSVEHNCWRFTLPNLFSFLQHHDDAFISIEYKQFRQLIFSSPINQTIKSHDTEITIAENRDKVDKSVYALVWETGK